MDQLINSDKYCNVQENCKLLIQANNQYNKVVLQNQSLQKELRHSTLLKYLNNEIVKWENLYGYWYTYLYNSDGSQKPEYINDEQSYKALNESRVVMQVLNKIKRNRSTNLKRLEKRKYKINN